MAACKGCGSEIRWMDTFPGDICVNCHRDKMAGASAEQHYKEVMGGFGDAAVPTNFKVSKRKKDK